MSSNKISIYKISSCIWSYFLTIKAINIHRFIIIALQRYCTERDLTPEINRFTDDNIITQSKATRAVFSYGKMLNVTIELQDDGRTLEIPVQEEPNQ